MQERLHSERSWAVVSQVADQYCIAEGFSSMSVYTDAWMTTGPAARGELAVEDGL